MDGPGVEVTKPLFFHFSVTGSYNFAKVYVRYPKLRSYLSGFSATELR